MESLLDLLTCLPPITSKNVSKNQNQSDLSPTYTCLAVSHFFGIKYLHIQQKTLLYLIHLTPL